MDDHSTGHHGYRTRRFSPTAVGATVAIHAALLLALLAMGVGREVAPDPEVFSAVEFSMAPPVPAPSPVSEPVESPAQTSVVIPAITAPTPRLTLAPSAPPARPLALPPAEPGTGAGAAAAAPAPATANAAPAAPSITPPQFDAAQLGNPAPTYPVQSRRLRQEGVVMLRVLVSAEGRARTVQIDRSSGHDPLDKSALRTVRKWRFLPARRGGSAITAWVLVPITFALG